jgi:hypothetical protein
MNRARAISVLENIRLEVDLSINRFENLKKMVDDVVFWLQECDQSKASGPTGDEATDFIIATLMGEK